ncbi:MAG: AI-2E family transporter [Paludibacter sp.]|nr:AI-2E family transporter [Paludibacter sp.]
MIPTKPFTFDRVIRLLIGLVIIALVFLLVQRLSNVLLPFLIAWLLAYMLDPLVRFFQYKLKLKNRILSVVITVLLVSAAIVGASIYLVDIIGTELNRLYEITSRYSNGLNIYEILPAKWQTEFNAYFLSMDLHSVLHNKDILEFTKKAAPQVWNLLNGSINMLLSLMVVLIILLYMFFILLDYERVTNGMMKIFPIKYRTVIAEILHDLEVGMNRYFRGQALVSLIVGVLFSIGFSIIQLPMAIFIGLLIGLLTMVPYLKVVALVPTVLLGLLQSIESQQSFSSILIGIAIVFIVIQAIEDVVITPSIMGRVTGLNPAVILLALSIWGSLMGLVGLIIALPFTTLIISYYKRFVLKHEVDEENDPENE